MDRGMFVFKSKLSFAYDVKFEAKPKYDIVNTNLKNFTDIWQ